MDPGGLEILRRYLDAYTTALKSSPFRLIYIDAFAGAGSWSPSTGYDTDDYGEFRELQEGSAAIALQIQDKAFDRLIFVEKDPDRVAALERLRREHPNRDITVLNQDANEALPGICRGLRGTAVALDPFATEVSWESVTAIAQTEKVDCWILFPLMAITRMMPNNSEPPEAWAHRLDRVFGGQDYWRGVYCTDAVIRRTRIGAAARQRVHC